MDITIDRRAMERMYLLSAVAKEEISWLFEVEVTPSGLYIPDRIHVFPQECTGVSTDFNMDQALPMLMAMPKEQYLLANRGHGHSHVNMPPSPSGTDIDNIMSFGAQGFPWIVSIIVNKRREYTARYDVFQPIHLFSAVTLMSTQPTYPGLREEVEAEIAEKVKNLPKVVQGLNGGQGMRFPELRGQSWRDTVANDEPDYCYEDHDHRMYQCTPDPDLIELETKYGGDNDIWEYPSDKMSRKERLEWRQQFFR